MPTLVFSLKFCYFISILSIADCIVCLVGELRQQEEALPELLHVPRGQHLQVAEQELADDLHEEGGGEDELEEEALHEAAPHGPLPRQEPSRPRLRHPLLLEEDHPALEAFATEADVGDQRHEVGELLGRDLGGQGAQPLQSRLGVPTHAPADGADHVSQPGYARQRPRDGHPAPEELEGRLGLARVLGRHLYLDLDLGDEGEGPRQGVLEQT